MKKLAVVGAVLLCGAVVFAADKATKKVPIEEIRDKVAEVIKNPERMGEFTAQLSAADQNTFMIEVNKAVASMPGSNEARTAKFLVIEREALLAAEKGNLQPMVATMFSTVPLEALTVLADRYADDLFNRQADATKSFTDEQFTEIAASTVKEVSKKVEGLPDSAPRNVLAVYLFEKSSSWSIPDLEDRLLEIAISDPAIRSVAKNEWLPAAKGEGADRFSAMLAYADAGRAPNVDVTLKIAGPQMLTAMLNDLSMGVMDSNGQQIMPITLGENPSEKGITTPGPAAAAAAAASEAKPLSANPLVPWNPQYSRSQVEDAQQKAKSESEPEPKPGPEPKPYQYQD